MLGLLGLGCYRLVTISIVYPIADDLSGRYLAWNCQAPQGARGGKCLGTTGLYQPNIPDYYVQSVKFIYFLNHN